MSGSFLSVRKSMSHLPPSSTGDKNTSSIDHTNKISQSACTYSTPQNSPSSLSHCLHYFHKPTDRIDRAATMIWTKVRQQFYCSNVCLIRKLRILLAFPTLSRNIKLLMEQE